MTATRTDKVPNTAPTAASSGSDLNGMAARRAARTIRRRLAGLAARLFQVREADVAFGGGMVRVGAETVPFERLSQLAFTERVSLSSTGYYATPKITWDRDTASGRPFLYFAGGAACSEVTVDIETGEMRVDRVDILHDAGRSLNPAIDMGQIEGGFVQGMGWLTTEELVFGEDGRLLTHAPSTYKIPTCSDVPADFRVELYEARPQPRAPHPPLEGGRRAAAAARDLGVLRHHPRAGESRAGAGAAAGRAGDAGGDSAGGGCDARGWLPRRRPLTLTQTPAECHSVSREAKDPPGYGAAHTHDTRPDGNARTSARIACINRPRKTPKYTDCIVASDFLAICLRYWYDSPVYLYKNQRCMICL